MGGIDPREVASHAAKYSLMKPILATVLNVDKQGNEYVVTVQLKGEEPSRKFDMLLFENKPDVGWIHHGWLDLIYHRDPNLAAGQVFQLWSASAT
jgi:hypothetical protein